jgi:hypothetical protein
VVDRHVLRNLTTCLSDVHHWGFGSFLTKEREQNFLLADDKRAFNCPYRCERTGRNGLDIPHEPKGRRARLAALREASFTDELDLLKKIVADQETPPTPGKFTVNQIQDSDVLNSDATDP